MQNVKFIFIYWATLCLLLVASSVCVGQGDRGQMEGLALRQRLIELGDISPQVRKVDDPTVRVFLQLRIATLLWSDGGEDFAAQAQSLTTGAMEELDAQKELVPRLYADLFRRDLIALLEVNAPELAKRYKADSAASGIDVAYSTLNMPGQQLLAVDLLNKDLANGLVADQRIIFFLHRLEQEKPSELPRALSDLISAEERRVGTIPVEVLLWLVDFYLNPNAQDELRQRFLRAAVLATAGGSTVSDSNQVNGAYNLLRAILPQVKSLVPSLYPQASGQLSSLMARRVNTKSEQEKIAERIHASDDPLSQTISEARSTDDRNLKDELFLEAAHLALEKGKLQWSLDLATSLSSDTGRKKWQEQVLTQLANAAIEKKDTEIAIAAISRIESPLTRVAAMQKLSLYFFGLKETSKARELLTDTLKVINSLQDKTEKTLALFRILSLVLKVDDELAPDVCEQIIKSINSIPTPDNKTDKTVVSEYVKKTLMPVAWQTLPAFELLTQWDDATALGLVPRIQLREVRTSAVLGVAMGRFAIAKKNKAAAAKGNKRSAHHGIQSY